jgi:hypothetical protein
MSLHERTAAFIVEIIRGRAGRQDLEDFVLAEIGMASDERLNNSAPLVLYFATDEDRREFFRLIMEAKPGMISRKWP